MRTYAYVRLDSEKELENDVFYSFFRENGFNISKNRIFFEIVLVNKPLKFRDKFRNIIDYSLEQNDLLVVKGFGDLGSNFTEILSVTNKIFEKGVRLICIDFSKNEINGDLRVYFLHFLKLVSDFEILFNYNNVGQEYSCFRRKVGRPEVLTTHQKIEVVSLYKQGCSVYGLSKKYGVARSVIIRILRMFE
ncbi:resolvase [Acinetobacter seifertii]|uniref:Resolvase n=1 Tax=Acinetobacter seifertii TaxID=1530123 RepID=A0A7H2VAX5_9GAMM|nr:resolvase [Acinetobacter seifertii]MBZ6534071.1 resolvase [Acinetobacter seifertii]QNX73508.1 resolvase [Acinetobacter seifertii]